MSSVKNAITATLGAYTFTFDALTGAWNTLSYQGHAILDKANGLAEITLITDGVTTVSTGRGHLDNIRNAIPVGAKYQLTSHQITGNSISLTLQEGGWTVEETFSLNADHNRIERSAVLHWQGEGECLLRWAEMTMPVFSRETFTTLEMPGYNGILHQPLNRLPPGRYQPALNGADVDGANWRPGVLAVGGDSLSLVSWLYGEDMPAIWQVYNGKRGPWTEQKWVCCCRMNPGDRLAIGTQYFTVSEQPILDALDCIRPFWNDAGLYTQRPAGDWAKQSFIYEAHIGAKESRRAKPHEPYPTPKDLTADLPRIKDLGFTVIELMPHFPYPAYSVSDYFDIDVCYGAKEEIVELIATAHDLGMRVFLDVVMHGVSDRSISPRAQYEHHPLLTEHPEFFIQLEDGGVARTYTWSFDQANPELRAYIERVFCYYITELDADGFRVDALTWNYFPNWKKGLSYPGYKSIDGCFELFERVRDAVWAIKPDVAFYSETTGPLMARSYDLSYNYDEVWMYESLLPLEAWAQNLSNWNKFHGAKPLTARDASQWLALRQKVLPENWTKVHHADSHDTHEWGGLGAFRRESMGIAKARALFAYCCFVEGAVMNFVGGEWGSEEIYKNLIRARKAFPALLSGSCDYTAVSSENENLFLPLRKKDGETLLPVINFSGDDANTRICLGSVGVDTAREWLLEEYFTGKQIRVAAADPKELPLAIGGYGFQLWRIIACK